MAGILDLIDAPADSLYGMLNKVSPDMLNSVPGYSMRAPDDPYADLDKKQKDELAKKAALGVFDTGAAPVQSAGVSGQMAMQPGPFGSLAPMAPQQPASPQIAAAPAIAAADPAQTSAPIQGPVPLPQPRPVAATPMPGPQPPVAAPIVKPTEDAALPPNATPTSGGPLPAAAPAPQRPGLMDGLNNYIDTHRGQLMAMAGGLAGAPSIGAGIGRGFTAAAAALPADQKAQQFALQQGGNRATYEALVAAGAPKQQAIVAAFNPESSVSKALIQSYIVDRGKSVQVLKDPLGGEHPYEVNKFAKDGEPILKPIDINGGTQGAPGGAGPSLLASGVSQFDSSKTGDDYLNQFSPEVQAAAKAYMNGDVMPTGNPRTQSIANFAKTVAQKYGQDTGVPVNDSLYAAKRKMQTDLASSGNSSMGGILSNGESSFKHLAEYTASAAEQGNTSHNFPLGGAVAHAQNYIGNTGGGSDTLGKVKAINDNLGKYGAESTKFYAGTGGGVEERLNALKEMNGTTTSGEEAAAYAEKEKGLMLDRLNTKFQEIRNTLGEERGNAEIAKHMPDIQKNIAAIDGNIARLRGTVAPAASAASSPAASPATATGPDGHKIVSQGGRWVDAQTGQPVQ